MGVAQRLTRNVSAQIAKCLWEAHDLLKAELLNKPFRGANDFVIEDSITGELELRMHRILSGDEPFDVQHQSSEWETCAPGSTRPPTYDLAFVLRANSQSKWPVEAKVLRTPGQVSAYVADLKQQFLTCRYAPFSSEGAMLGYLLSGTTDAAFAAIEVAIPTSLIDYPGAAGRPHKTSDHSRTVPVGKRYPAVFRCHHLLMMV
jgi:hypothetical protein